MQQIQLRTEDQVPFKNAVYQSWQKGNRNVLAVANTGFGKSVVMSDIVLDHHNMGQKCAVTAHRNELVSQMSCHIANRGIPHKIIGSSQTIAEVTRKHREKYGRSFLNPSAVTAVVGVDTMIARKDHVKDWARQIDCWLGDEDHHKIGNWQIDERGNPVYTSGGEPAWRVEPNKWGKAAAMFTNARGVGFTATPSRADGQGLGWDYDGVFHDMVLGPPMRWLIDRGYLADYEIVCPASDLSVDDSPLSKDGDWSNATLRKAAKKSHIVGDVVKNYQLYANGRKAIVFATDVETANEISAQFNASGIRAVSLNGKSNPAYREQSLKQFEKGDITVLVNVDLFDEGFDVPNVEVCIMARPTASLGKYLQMAGRVMRYVAGKIALIIDHVSNVIRHKLPDWPRIWSLARRDKRAKAAKDPDEIPLTVCKNCRKPYESFRVACPYCNTAKPLPLGSSRSIEQVDGDLILLDRETLARMRQATILDSAADVGNRAAYAAGGIAGKASANRQVEKIGAYNTLKETMAVWAAIERSKGFNDREIMRKFYLTTGVDVLGALDASQTRQQLEEMNDLIRSWYAA